MTMFGSQWLANPGVTYEIDQSIRFNDNDSSYLNRTPGSAGNRRTFTFSCWVKRANLTGANQPIFSAGGDDWLMFLSAETLGFNTSGSNYRIVTSQVFVDPAAWFHLVLRVDTTDSTAGDRLRFYLNGTEVTDLGTDTNPTLNFETSFNNTGEHSIGKLVGASQYFDGYLAEINHIDGSSLGPSSFGETNSDTGQWVPKAYSGSYGTNGFYITGEDSSDLGDDESGNGNDFSSSGLAAADQVKDSPTNNLPTLNPLSSGTGALSDGNLQYTGVSGNWSNSRLNLLVPDTGKWAIRMKSASSYQQIIVGLCAPDGACPYTDIDVNNVVQIRYNTLDGNFVTRVGGSLVNDTSAPTTAAQTFFQLLFDMDNGKLGVAADGASSGTFADTSTYSILDLNGASLSTARQPFVQAYAGTDANAGVIIDAGQSGWETTVTGFKNLSLANLDDPTIDDPGDYFQTVLYTGNGSSRTISGVGFQPDWVWIKDRNVGENHYSFDAVRGAEKKMHQNTTGAEGTESTALTGFVSDGFTLGDGSSGANTNTRTYVSWNWLAGNATSTPSGGSVSSTVSVNQTSGFSIVSWTGTGANATVAHGLGATPKVVIVKNRSASGGWFVGNIDVGFNYEFRLDENGARSGSATLFNETNPTSTVFSVGSASGTNGSSNNMIAYCFAEIDGFSKFSTYEGNGSSDGPFVYLGFKPRFLIVRRYDGADGWAMLDTARGSGNFGSAAGATGKDPTAGNEMNNKINANDSFAEEDNAGGSRKCSFLSNGFKVKNTNTAMNTSGGDYFYMAFAESPFKTATAR